MRPRCCALQRFIKHCVSHFKRRCAQLSLRIMGSTSCNRIVTGCTLGRRTLPVVWNLEHGSLLVPESRQQHPHWHTRRETDCRSGSLTQSADLGPTSVSRSKSYH